jgi:anti-anti-sigma factor
MSNFKLLDCHTHENVLVAAILETEVSGEETAMLLKSELLQAVNEQGVKKLVIDFQRVKYMTSRPFGAIAGFRAEFVRKMEGKVALCGLSPQIREALSALHFISGTERSSVIRPANTGDSPKSAAGPLFEIVADDVESAVKELNRS